MGKNELLKSRYGEYIKNTVRNLDKSYECNDENLIRINRAKWESIKESLLYILGINCYFVRRKDAYMVCIEDSTDYFIYVERM